MSLKLLGFVSAMILYVGLSAQTITGHLSLLNNQQIKLEGFNGLNTYPISITTIGPHGNFKLNYSKADYGVGYLMSADNRPFIVILSGEDIEIIGEALSYTETLVVTKGQENQWFAQYAHDHPRREQALSAWVYLEKIYTLDSLFQIQQTPREAIQTEIQRIHMEDATFLAGLPEDSYVSWFLPMRKLVSAVPVVAQYRTDEIPATIAAFRSIDYTNPFLYKSGLFKDAIESHFWLLENSGNSLDAVYAEMKTSIDSMMINLVTDEMIFNEVTDYLFDLLERHSLFTASEYLALKVLNEVSCTIDDNLAKQLETYRAMKTGNSAPDIMLDKKYIANPISDMPDKLSAIQSDYKVVVFGASWCHACAQEIPEIAKHYAKWKAQGVEVVFISLDEDKSAFMQFAGKFPFLSYCDLQKWSSPVVKDYYVFATPTMFLLDRNRKILLRPRSVNQMDSWVDWYLIQGNPLPSN